MNTVGILLIAGTVALYLLVVGIVVLGIMALPGNCLFGVVALLVSLSILYAWRPYRRWLGTRNSSPIPAQERVLDAARGVAERIKITPPVVVSISPWPQLGAGAEFRVRPIPHFERYVVIGIPILASLTVSETKALLAHAMVRTQGIKALTLPPLGKLLYGVWRAVEYLSHHLIELILSLVAMGILFAVLFWAPQFLLGYFSLSRYAVSTLWAFSIPILAVSVLLGLIAWVGATWYRRSSLLADQTVARSFGRNTLLQALNKRRLVERTFARQWPGLSSDARWGKWHDSNLYAEFRKIWESFPPAYIEKSLREVAAEHPAFVYTEPILNHRAELLRDVPDQLTDDRPADILLPGIGDVAAAMTESLYR